VTGGVDRDRPALELVTIWPVLADDVEPQSAAPVSALIPTAANVDDAELNIATSARTKGSAA
jgi:hypothetical protein